MPPRKRKHDYGNGDDDHGGTPYEEEGGADHAEGLAALLRRRDVGDIGIGRGVGGAANAGDQPAEEEPGDGRREGGEEIVDAETGDGEQKHRAPAIGVGEIDYYDSRRRIGVSMLAVREVLRKAGQVESFSDTRASGVGVGQLAGGTSSAGAAEP